jgi:Lrp/AsnC family leucine-responsive transcriptional regulator
MASEEQIKGEIDRLDRAILRELAADGRMSVTDLAEKVGLSKSPCQVRLKRLQAEGYIRGFRAVIDPGRLGLDHVAFVEVRLKDTTEGALRAFNAAVQKVPEIEQCHMIAGAFDYLLKVRTRDIRAYREVLGEVISALPHVAATSTHVSMEAVKDDTGGWTAGRR